jgi:hypothetical protein
MQGRRRCIEERELRICLKRFDAIDHFTDRDIMKELPRKSKPEEVPAVW